MKEILAEYKYTMYYNTMGSYNAKHVGEGLVAGFFLP